MPSHRTSAEHAGPKLNGVWRFTCTGALWQHSCASEAAFASLCNTRRCSPFATERWSSPQSKTLAHHQYCTEGQNAAHHSVAPPPPFLLHPPTGKDQTKPSNDPRRQTLIGTIHCLRPDHRITQVRPEANNQQLCHRQTDAVTTLLAEPPGLTTTRLGGAAAAGAAVSAASAPVLAAAAAAVVVAPVAAVDEPAVSELPLLLLLPLLPPSSSSDAPSSSCSRRDCSSTAWKMARKFMHPGGGGGRRHTTRRVKKKPGEPCLT